MTFTVKVRDSDALGGNERLYSCDNLEVVFPGPSKLTPGASNWDEAGIYLDPTEEIVETTKDVFTTKRMAKHVILFGGDYSDEGLKRKGGWVYVTNEAGATVANYDL